MTNTEKHTPTFSAKSLEDIARVFDGFSDNFRGKSLMPRDTVPAKRFNAGVAYGYEQAAKILRDTALNTPDLLAQNKRMRGALEQANTAMRGIFGDGPVRGNGPLWPEYKALIDAAIKARDALNEKE